MPPLESEHFEWNCVEIPLKTTSFYTKEYEKDLEKRGISEKSRQASDLWNAIGDKMKGEFQCQDQ